MRAAQCKRTSGSAEEEFDRPGAALYADGEDCAAAGHVTALLEPHLTPRQERVGVPLQEQTKGTRRIVLRNNEDQSQT